MNKKLLDLSSIEPSILDPEESEGGNNLLDELDLNSSLKLDESSLDILNELEKSSFVSNDEFFQEKTKLTEYEERDYQYQLFEKSKDKNSILVLETGSGKTVISIFHILHCLKKYKMQKKVIITSQSHPIDCLFGQQY